MERKSEVDLCLPKKRNLLFRPEKGERGTEDSSVSEKTLCTMCRSTYSFSMQNNAKELAESVINIQQV